MIREFVILFPSVAQFFGIASLVGAYDGFVTLAGDDIDAVDNKSALGVADTLRVRKPERTFAHRQIVDGI